MNSNAQQEMLKRGSLLWNRWRKAHPELDVDLAGLDLRGFSLDDCDLSGADMTEVDLRGASLARTTLAGAELNAALLIDCDLSSSIMSAPAEHDLAGGAATGVRSELSELFCASLADAQLQGSNLAHADIRGADLTSANLSGASLRGANAAGAQLSFSTMVDADLTGCSFAGATLANADIAGAYLEATIFASTDLSGCRGLGDVRPSGWYSVDAHTVIRSGELPITFLTQGGWPSEIADMQSLFRGRPIKMRTVFISYSHLDEAVADLIYRRLKGRGVDAFYAPQDLPWGSKTRDHIIGEIRYRDKLVVIFSEHSVKSDWVEDEVNTALDKEQRESRVVLLPIRIDQAVLNVDVDWVFHLRKKRNIGDFTEWANPDQFEKLFERLVKHLMHYESL